MFFLKKEGVYLTTSSVVVHEHGAGHCSALVRVSRQMESHQWEGMAKQKAREQQGSFGTNSLTGTSWESHEDYLIYSEGDASMTQVPCCRFHLLNVPAPPNMTTLRRKLQTYESWGTNSTYIQVITVSYWIILWSHIF